MSIFNSIKLKLTLYFAIVIAVILFGASFIIYENAYNNRISHLDGSLRIIVGDMLYDALDETEEFNTTELDEDSKEIEEQLKIDTVHLKVIKYSLTTDTESIVAKSSKTKNRVFVNWDFKEELQENKVYYQTLNNYRNAIEFIKMDKEMIIAIQTAVLISSKDESLQRTILTLFIVNFVIFLSSIFSAYFLISKALLPVHNIVVSVNEIEAYDYIKRISTKNIPNEIKELVDTFNELLSRHKESFNKISQFSSDASHELKTPLTVMRVEVEVGLRKERSKAEYKKILEDILSEIAKIQQLIDGLLFLAKTDKLEIKSTFKEVYIDEIITECVDELKQYAQKKSIILEISHLTPLTVEANSELLKVACFNLLKNAIDYSPKNKKIKIVLYLL